MTIKGHRTTAYGQTHLGGKIELEVSLLLSDVFFCPRVKTLVVALGIACPIL